MCQAECSCLAAEVVKRHSADGAAWTIHTAAIYNLIKQRELEACSEGFAAQLLLWARGTIVS